MSEGTKYCGGIEGLPDPVIVLDPSGVITEWNGSASTALGYARSEILGKSFSVLIAEDGEKAASVMLERTKVEGSLKKFITLLLNKSGTRIFADISAGNTADKGFVLVIRDVTKEKFVDQMKSEFVSNVSHELRTPLTSIKGAMDLVLSGSEGPITESQKEFLNISRNNTTRLIRLINDLLDLSKLEAGKIKMDLRPRDMAAIINATMSDFKALAGKLRIRLIYKGPSKLDMLVDEDRIKQVITNLMGNAFKFTPENGSVTVALSENDKEINISVEDTGEGIAKEHFGMIFEKFEQIDSSSTRAKGGTGLGLAIARSIVEAHKGRIWVESEKGKGSSFIFSMPKTGVPIQPQEMREAESSIPGQNERAAVADYNIKKILIIDDDEDIAKVLKEFLEKEGGYSVTAVRSSMEAFKNATEMKPDLITLDVLMPSKDGFILVDALKKNPATKDIPVVIISSIFEKEKALKLGVSEYIVKPFESGELVERIKSIEKQRNCEKRKMKILVVDDDLDISSVLTLYLSNKNYTVYNAYDGFQAMSYARLEKPDIIILDLMLPGLDGFEVLKKLKCDTDTGRIPIIVITGSGNKNREEAIKLGAMDYLVKPFTMKTLLGNLQSILKDGK